MVQLSIYLHSRKGLDGTLSAQYNTLRATLERDRLEMKESVLAGKTIQVHHAEGTSVATAAALSQIVDVRKRISRPFARNRISFRSAVDCFEGSPYQPAGIDASLLTQLLIVL